MMRSRPCIKSRRCHCDDHDEARRLREDHARWFLRHVARKDRASHKGFVQLMSDLEQAIELEEAVPNE